MTPRIAAKLDRDFKLADQDAALSVMDAVLASDPERTAEGMERIHAAMLLLAGGNLQRLLDAAALAELDWRDLFMDAGLGSEDWRDRIAEELGPPI